MENWSPPDADSSLHRPTNNSIQHTHTIMANQNLCTRSSTVLVEMSKHQQIAVAGELMVYLIKTSRDICDVAYPDPSVGDNGKPTYLDLRFSTERRNDGFKTHVINFEVTFKGSYREDVLDIMDHCISTVHEHILWFLSAFKGWKHATSKRVIGALQGSWKCSVQHVSDTIGLSQAVSNWADPVWQANRACRIVCRAITVAIFARILESI